MHPELCHAGFVEDLDVEPERREAGGPLGQGLGVDDIGRLGDEVAGEGDSLGYSGEIAVSGPSRNGGRACDGERRQRGFALRRLGRAVLVEAVGAQLSTEGKMRCGVDGLYWRRITEIDGNSGLARPDTV